MATDRRELILARLLQVLAGIDEIRTCVRNKGPISDDASALPAIQLFDADEEVDDNDPPRMPVDAPRRVHLMPQIWITAMTVPESVGTDINALRVKVLHAVLNDATLLSYLTDDRVRYLACQTDLAQGRQMQALMILSFRFTYMLKVNELAP